MAQVFSTRMNLTTSGTWWGFILFRYSSLTLELAKSYLSSTDMPLNVKLTALLWVFTANLTNIVNDLILTPAPGLRCWAGGPGMCGSDTADSCPSRMFSEPTPQPGCAVTHTNTHRGNKCTFKPLKQHYSCFFSFLFKHSCVFLLFVLESHIQAHG